MSIQTPATEVAVARVREEVAALHAELVRLGIVAVSGSLSGRVPDAELFVITPAATLGDAPGPESMIVCDLDGRVVPDSLGAGRTPSADTAEHAELYRARGDVGGIALTASVHAAAWSATGAPLPCLLRDAVAAFGSEIPCAPAPDDAHAAVLLPNRGALTTGSDARAAATAAVLVERTAHTAFLTRTLPTTDVMTPPSQPKGTP